MKNLKRLKNLLRKIEAKNVLILWIFLQNFYKKENHSGFDLSLSMWNMYWNTGVLWLFRKPTCSSIIQVTLLLLVYPGSNTIWLMNQMKLTLWFFEYFLFKNLHALSVPKLDTLTYSYSFCHSFYKFGFLRFLNNWLLYGIQIQIYLDLYSLQ